MCRVGFDGPTPPEHLHEQGQILPDVKRCLQCSPLLVICESASSWFACQAYFLRVWSIWSLRLAPPRGLLSFKLVTLVFISEP